MKSARFLVSLLFGCAAFAWSHAAFAQSQAPLVTQAVSDGQVIELGGNMRPEALPANDRGVLADDFRLDHMQILLKRSPETDASLVRLIDTLYNPASPSFHHWLTAAQFGTWFGPNAADIQAVTNWLSSHGFTVNGISTGRTTIDFSGTAGQVGRTFHTSVHRLQVGGSTHIANMSNPSIPAALSGVVAGVVSLNDFRPHTNFKNKPAYTAPIDGSTYQTVVPADLATIYNLNPLFNAGISGQGQTVVVIEDTDVYSVADWKTFRYKFGLTSYSSGRFKQVHPTGSNACGAPGVVSGNEEEAELDAEWASAAAPSAVIELASCADTFTTFGGLLALQNLINAPKPPAIVSISYGECEAENGATANAAYYATYQQAVALGVSVFVSSGDEGAASCDANQTKATHGIAVSGFASTPYNVAVGGTDFGDTYAGTTSKYWAVHNTAGYGSAKSYIPEIPWNDSCASVLITSALGYTTPYGSGGSCNSAAGEDYFLSTASGSGGPSGCATGVTVVPGVVGGTCAGYAKPSWQAIVGNPADGVRDIPDVSLFAANGVWSHFYVFCDSDTADGGVACTGAPINWAGAGGTSFASPILAGIQALVNQKNGGAQGNPNPVYYKLASNEYGSAGNPTCNSTKGRGVGASCVFYDVTLGDMDVNCTGAEDCYRSTGTNGVLSTSNKAYDPAYGTSTGWDFATGIGSLNAANLVNNW